MKPMTVFWIRFVGVTALMCAVTIITSVVSINNQIIKTMAIKILKKGKDTNKTHKKTCGSCKCKFEYQDSDVEHDWRDGGWNIYCPECGKFILIKSERTVQTDRSSDC
jgi:predicted RNA-binding Zn-ribbon protein involved in translation (DUF1610 family)